MRYLRMALVSIAALGLAGCSSSATAAKASIPTTATASSPTTLPPTTTSTTPPLSGPVGTTYTESGTDNSGNPIEMAVTLTQVTDPASGTAYETPNAGERFVGATFKIVGMKGTSSDDANSDAVIIGSNQQTYSPSFDSLASCTNFNSGEFTVDPQQTSIGCVAFQVPTGVHVTSIQWSPSSSSTRPATWVVSP